jgi:NADH-quinone oxidoreductase subunit M
LESFLFLFFLSQNALTFYIAFEATLIPLFFIIVLFGGKNRSEAAVKFLIYNFLGSLFFIVALIILYNETQTFDIQELTQKTTGLIKSGLLSKKKSCFLFLMIFLSFAIKLPLVPFHGWLPKAHVEAPTTGSVMLAGIVLKMAGFGILRLLLPVFTPINALFSIPFAIFGIASLVVASFLCLSQKHFKKLIAYSSIAHMGYVMIGLSGVCKNRYDEIGTLGAIAQMLSHGLISASLFFCVGMLYERTNTLEIKKLGGIKHSMPFYHGLFFLSLLGAISLPGTSGFIGEFFSIFSFYRTHDFYIVLPSLVLILLCVVLTSFYMLSNYRQIFLQPQVCKNVIDITFNERAILIILLFFMFLIGLYPNALLM